MCVHNSFTPALITLQLIIFLSFSTVYISFCYSSSKSLDIISCFDCVQHAIVCGS